MRILQVIHGYPMRFNAGSEVYTQALAQALSGRHQVQVFTRQEDAFAPDYTLRRESDPDDPRVQLHLVNLPNSRDRYRHEGVDQRFAEVVDAFKPHVVHVGHLNHLSTSLIEVASARQLPIVFTLHDYWLMCPRGQFMQIHPEDPKNLWAACSGQENRKCAERCYARYFSGASEEWETDIAHWQGWVHRRMEHVRRMAEQVDLFIAPSRYMLARFRDDFGLPASKLVYLDYGFDLARLRGRQRSPEPELVFGYIGTHIPAKGIHHLLQAFGKVKGQARLRIWGRPRGADTEALQAMARALPGDAATRVEWRPEYRNADIVRDVFDRVDAIVVPSVWVENSPLVIHEALQARVPVITADAGGMREYVRDGVNGLLFTHREPESLARAMQRLVDEPGLAASLGARGYLQSESGDVPGMKDHVQDVEALYARVIRHRREARRPTRPGPWRITFDTNPDDCNLKCIMCEEHSPFSHTQREREAAGVPKRRMPLSLLRRVMEDSRDTPLREVIPSTMGEPLLYAHFDDIIDLCMEHGVLMNLTTNGTFPRRGAREWARRLVPIVSDVKISWNGATKQTQEAVMLGTRWERVLENVRTFISERDAHARTGGHRCRVTLQLTFLETNVAELADIVRLAASLGVDRVKGHHLWAHFEQIQPLSMRRGPESIARWNAAVHEAREAAATHLLPDGRRVLLENIHLLGADAVADLAPGAQCPFLGKEAWVSALGRFDPCCAPDKERRTLGEFGDLNHVGIQDVWNGEKYRRLRETYAEHPLCRGCNMRQPVGAP
ncbi:glycosyltransferase [Pyxidicoccus parkwayensis]|uniref:Glycosyltransferase n=1 Tax=Pyxidicoccus parkwayensis TaxID=2813578 RepID=A0ABX7P0H1_9BACT|nr:glycosyltransferase [Pyxidicoccus parkwaysis]QSQ21803.1 glycosyltransferase [Pyxidicoccus parkwaysis]